MAKKIKAAAKEIGDSLTRNIRLIEPGFFGSIVLSEILKGGPRHKEWKALSEEGRRRLQAELIRSAKVRQLIQEAHSPAYARKYKDADLPSPAEAQESLDIYWQRDWTERTPSIRITRADIRRAEKHSPKREHKTHDHS